MNADPSTMLLLTMAMAAISASYLLLEWRIVREAPLLFWSAGFATITLGCFLSPYRAAGLLFWGLWFANGCLVVAHLLFLQGVARFLGRRVAPGWWALLLVWAALLPFLGTSWQTSLYSLVNATLVAAITLRSAGLLLASEGGSSGARLLSFVFLGHGLFYLFKAVTVFVPGAMVDLKTLQGFMIPLSLFEGLMIMLLISLSMTGTVRRRREERVTLLSERDPLTAVFNRRSFEARSPALLRNAQRLGRQSALLMLDLDHFKQVNDGLGHATGDRLLLALATVLGNALPPTALVARLGGDEFAVVVPDITQAEVLRLGEGINEQVRKLDVDFGRPSVSIGAVLLGSETIDLDVLAAAADAALYEAKRQGRDRICVGSLPTGMTGAARNGAAPVTWNFSRA